MCQAPETNLILPRGGCGAAVPLLLCQVAAEAEDTVSLALGM